MTKELFRNIVCNDACCIEFECNNQDCGCEYITVNGKNIYKLWYGDTLAKFESIEEAMDYKMFNGLNAIDYINKTDYSVT